MSEALKEREFKIREFAKLEIARSWEQRCVVNEDDLVRFAERCVEAALSRSAGPAGNKSTLNPRQEIVRRGIEGILSNSNSPNVFVRLHGDMQNTPIDKRVWAVMESLARDYLNSRSVPDREAAQRTYCHLCREYFEGPPDGHGLGECVELCAGCLENQADYDESGKQIKCAGCQRFDSSGNYTANHVVAPTEVTFANGRIVRVVGEGFLEVSRAESPSESASGTMPSCHVCGTIMTGVCPKCSATTKVESASGSTIHHDYGKVFEKNIKQLRKSAPDAEADPSGYHGYQQCAWVYMEGGQFQGQCPKNVVAGKSYCKEHEESAPEEQC